MFFDKVLASFHFCQVEAVDFGDFGGKVRMKFDDVVIETMGRELVMGLLGGDVSRVFAPFRYDWFCCLDSLHNLGGDSGLVN